MTFQQPLPLKRYGLAVTHAVRHYLENPALGPRDAWQQAVEEVFRTSPSQQAKGCPRSAFLGLCGEGMVKGIPAGQYTRSMSNKAYAIAIANLLMTQPELADNFPLLWATVSDGEAIQHNEQIDVVVALWRSGMLAMN